MYCSSCGVAVTQGLRFCNHCGTRLYPSTSGDEPGEIKPDHIIAAMGAVFIFGLFGISLLTFLLSEGVHLNAAQIMAFTGTSLLIMVGLEAAFATLLFRRRRRSKETDESKQLPQPVTKELHPMSDRSLAEPVPSVTEHTTRAFDPAYAEKVKK